MYNHLIAKGCDIYYRELKSDDFVSIGTPEDYLAAAQKLRDVR